MDTSSILTNINPGASKLKRFVVRVSFFVLGRGLQAASRFDNQVKGEVSGWNEGFTVVMKVKWPNLSLAWQKSGDRITYMGSKVTEADLTVVMKNLESAFLMMTAQIGTSQAYAQHRLQVEGDIVNAMVLTRCLNSVEAYLFPKFISKKILKRLPRMGLRGFCTRFLIYFLGVILGV